MGNCCSPGTDAPPPDFNETSSSTPGSNNGVAVTGQGSITPQLQSQVPILSSNSVDYKTLGQTLDHISDREDNTNKDETMFLKLSHVAMKMMKTGRQRHSTIRLLASPSAFKDSPLAIKKANSCSTIYFDDSTVSLPDLKFTLKCASLAVFYIVKGRPRDRPPKTLDIFDEKLHPLTRETVPDHYADFTPDHKVIYKFIKTLFHAAQLTSECAIITIIYLERLLQYSELDLHPCNWKRILLGAILLASKVWDDQAVWNVDYCQILREISVSDMNELERVYLEQIQFNINVPAKMYAKYYFDLRTLSEENGLTSPSEYLPLTKDRAHKIEALSQVADDKMTTPYRKLQRSHSSEAIPPKKISLIIS